MTRRTAALAFVVLTGTAAASPFARDRRDREPTLQSCRSCHLANGFGRPDTSSIAGLPAAYIEQQFADFRRGVRKIGEARDGQFASMATVATLADDDLVRRASAYFASLEYTTWIHVVETDSIGNGIVEMPRDGASGFVAFVPVGSIMRGEALVTSGGGGRTVRCALCHGADLRGHGSVP